VTMDGVTCELGVALDVRCGGVDLRTLGDDALSIDDDEVVFDLLVGIKTSEESPWRPCHGFWPSTKPPVRSIPGGGNRRGARPLSDVSTLMMAISPSSMQPAGACSMLPAARRWIQRTIPSWLEREEDTECSGPS